MFQKQNHKSQVAFDEVVPIQMGICLHSSQP